MDRDPPPLRGVARKLGLSPGQNVDQQYQEWQP